ncbi:hypothetical protein EMCRGX_G016170 [Ephydatia muelleri]
MPSYLLLLAITSLQTSEGGTGSTSQITNLSLCPMVHDAEHDNGAAPGEGCDHVALVYQEEVVSTYYTPDGFDAVSVQNVGSTYIIVSWDLPTHSNGILINFSLYCNGALAGVLPLTVISYDTTGLLLFTLYMYITLSVGQVLQSRPQALHSSWNVVLGVISAAASLPSTL